MKYFGRVLIAVVLTVIVGLGVLFYSHYRLPTTAEMEDFFSKHRSAFERKNADVLFAVSQNRAIDSGPDTEIGYQFLEIRPESPLMVKYFTHVRGIGVGAFGTGIAYLESPPGKTARRVSALLAPLLTLRESSRRGNTQQQVL